MAELPLQPIKRLMKQHADRVGEDAVKEMRDELERHAAEITETADTFARHADRKTVQGEDVKAATRR